MKEEQINKRIKELQSDSRFTFKLTEDIIESVYKIAINDMAETNSNQKISESNVNDHSDVVVMSSKDLNDAFGTKPNKKSTKKFGSKEVTYTKEQLHEEVEKNIQRTKRDCFSDILNEIEKTNDLMDVYIYVKEKCKEYGEPGVRNKYDNRRRSRENPWM